MAVEKWVTGVTSGTWTSAIGAVEVASIASGNSILSTVSVTAGSSTAGYDVFADLSISMSGSMVTTGVPFIGVYAFPANATSGYGSLGVTTSTGGNAVVPPNQYFIGSIGVATSSASSTAIAQGTLAKAIIPPGNFVFGFYNGTGATWPSSVIIQYQTFNRQIS